MPDASAQFIIDIAAQMSGLDPTVAGLDSLSSELSGISKDSAAFSDAITDLGSQLDGVKAASLEANAALADGATEYRQLERAATMMAKRAEKAALKNAGIIPADLKAKSDAAAASVNAFAGKLGKLEKEAFAAAAAEKKLVKQLGDVRTLQGHVNRTFARSSEDVSKLQSGFAAMGGPLGRLGQQASQPIKAFADLRQVIGGTRAAMIVGVIGVAALAAAIVVLTAVMVAGVVAAAAYTVKLGDMRRSAGLAKEAFDAMNPAIAGLDYAGLSRDTGVASDKLQGLAKALRDAKVAADDLPAALRAAALAEKAGGGAASFIADLKAGKLSVQEFAAVTEQKLGGVVARQMLGLEAQGTRFKANVGGLFGGLNIEPALKGLRTLVALFDENTAAGKAIKLVFETIFKPLIDNAQNAAYFVEAFAIGFLIGITKMYIAVKPVIRAIADFFGFEDTSLADVLTLAKNAGELAFKVFLVGAAIFTLVAGAIAVVVAAVVGLAAFVAGALYIAIKNVIGVVTGLWEVFTLLAPTLKQAWADFVKWGAETLAAVSEAFEAVSESVTVFAAEFPATISQSITDAVAWFSSLPSRALTALQSLGPMLLGLFSQAWAMVTGFLSGVSLADLGKQLIQGLASGITAGVGAVVSAVKNAVGGAIKAAKSALGIASPSKVFADIGVNTTESYAAAVDKTAPIADAAVGDMVSPPAPNVPVPALASAPRSSAAPSTAQAGASKSLDMQGATFNFYGVEGAEDAESRFGELLTRVVEGDAAALGAARGATA